MIAPPAAERFAGCLLGGAVGDALGAPVEFLTWALIERAHGPLGITDFAAGHAGTGTITDDTQLALFTADGLLRGWLSAGADHAALQRETARAYQRWARTQGQEPAIDSGAPGWLFGQRALHQRRAPGATCLTALREMRAHDARARNDSKGCGGVMRVAPVGLFAACLKHAGGTCDSFRLAADLAALTHGHATGCLAAGAFALVIELLVGGASPPMALAAARARLRDERDHGETLASLDRAADLAASSIAPADALARLGQGWVAEEALAVALYAMLVARTFRDGAIIAVNHGGDSDSTGAIAGNLLGASLGVAAIPAGWLDRLELREVIETIAADLASFPEWTTADGAILAQMRDRYPA